MRGAGCAEGVPDPWSARWTQITPVYSNGWALAIPIMGWEDWVGSTPPPHPPTRTAAVQGPLPHCHHATGHRATGTCTYDRFEGVQGDPRGGIRTVHGERSNTPATGIASGSSLLLAAGFLEPGTGSWSRVLVLGAGYWFLVLVLGTSSWSLVLVPGAWY